jgi:uncharacterized membrane protein YhaH (DUF805 family)
LNYINESNGQLSFTDRMPRGLRVFIFLAGLIPFLAPYELLIRPRWHDVNVLLIFPVLISLGAVGVGIMFMLAGVLGLNQTLCFDISSRSVRYSYETAITQVRRKHYQFSDLEQIEIRTTDWESKPPTYGLRLIFADGRKVEMCDFDTRDEAEDYVNRIQNLVQ